MHAHTCTQTLRAALDSPAFQHKRLGPRRSNIQALEKTCEPSLLLVAGPLRKALFQNLGQNCQELAKNKFQPELL